MRRVAITGVGVVSPVASGLQAFWDALADGVSGIDTITHFDPDSFDAKLAGEVSMPVLVPGNVALAAKHDPKIAFGYAAFVEAMADAGLRELGNRALLHIATGLEVFELSKLICNGSVDFQDTVRHSLENKDAFLQMPLDTTANLIQEDYGRPASALTNCSACAASTQAIGHAFQSIREGRFDCAVCGGFDSMINPLGVGGFQLLGALTTSNGRSESACRPFDASRNGVVLGEGAGMLVLESLDKARRAGKKIYGEICGYGSTLDSFKVTAPAEDGNGAIRAMREALEDAHIAPSKISHINAHGTGTLLNDKIEAQAIRSVFHDSWRDISVSAVKSMTGHLIGACGAVETSAILMAFERNLLPPNPFLQRVGDGCELQHITESNVSYDGEYILKNSFGFGGQNAVIVLKRHKDDGNE
jgi:3-oxoacyl-[acyl-carrier-protein] synthase II